MLILRGFFDAFSRIKAEEAAQIPEAEKRNHNYENDLYTEAGKREQFRKKLPKHLPPFCPRLTKVFEMHNKTKKRLDLM